MRAALAVWLLGAALAIAAGPKEIELTTLTGERIRPADAGDGPFAVLVFVTTDCPIANAFQPELRRLEARAKELGGRFTLVQVVPNLKDEEARRHVMEFAVTAPVVIDREHALIKATGVEITPEAVVIARDGTLAYRGRIDNLFVTYGKRRVEPTEHDLRDAMEALAAGKPVTRPRTEALGCYIPSLP
jgi:hypothetical protein